MLDLDGSQGEGGGQILRTSLALSIVTGQPFRLHRIRARRKVPGLRPQHLVCLEAARAVSAAEVTGAEAGSGEITFRPGRVRAGEYDFRIGTAGSTGLVLQTILPPLMIADAPSRVTVEGGTHNPLAPPYDFLARTYLPVLARMGPQVSLTLERAGFYPAGGGRIVAQIQPAPLAPLSLLERGEVTVRGRILLANQPPHIAGKQQQIVAGRLHLDPKDVTTQFLKGVQGPGNAVLISITSQGIDEVVSAFREKRDTPADVALRANEAALRYLISKGPVGEHLADQILVPLALAGGGEFRTMLPTEHTRTNALVIERFLGLRIGFARDGTETWRVTVGTGA